MRPDGEAEGAADDVAPVEVPQEFADLAAMLARAREDAGLERAPIDPEVVAIRRRRRKRGWLTAGAIVLVVAVAAGSYVGVVLSAPLPLTAAVMVPIDIEPGPVADIALPDYGAGAVSVTGAEEFAGTAGADGILASTADDSPRPIASITKLITTLVILEAHPIGADGQGPTITFSKADHDLYDEYYVRGATIQPMRTGSTMSLHDALELMLVTSASNYAEAVSTWAFGSQARFRTATTDWLARNGLESTTIVEPVGLDPRNTSTTRDLIALGKLALGNPVVAEIVGLHWTDVPGFTGQPNTNTLLGVSGINGIKTGTLEEAGSCLLFSAVVDVGLPRPITIVGVVLGALDHSSAGLAAVAMIESIKAGFHPIPVVEAGDVLATYTTPWGERAEARAAQSARILTWSDTAVAAKASAVAVGLAEKRTKVGSAAFTSENRDVTMPLYLSEEIEGPDAWWRITHPAELFGG